MADEPKRRRALAGTRHEVRLDRDGVPVDPMDWTCDDWRDLWCGMQAVKAGIAARHRPGAKEGKGDGTNDR
jgi:hypothetical protein